jgi:hypothetical protein
LKVIPHVLTKLSSVKENVPNSNTAGQAKFSGHNLTFNPLNAELYPISHLLALLGAHPILHVSRIMVKISLLSQQHPKHMIFSSFNA